MSLPPPAPRVPAAARPYPPPYRPPVKARPGWGWYLAIAGFEVAVAIVGVVVIVASVVGYVDDLRRVGPGGDGQVLELDEGGYTVYVEGVSTRPLGEALHITGPDGAVVTLRAYDGTYTFDRGGRSGRAALTFHADHDGEYRVRLAAGEPSGPADAVYIGRGFARHVGASIRRGVIVGLVGTMLAVVATIALATARGRSRRRQGYAHGIDPRLPTVL